MEKKRNMVTFEVDNPTLKILDQRANQEGISRSDYVRECVYLDFILSGDLEATKFVAKRIGARVKDALVDKIRGVDVEGSVSRLESAQ